MSDLSTFEKIKLEKIFEMSSGYVLDFSNRTFQDFFIDNINIDIYDEKFSNSGTSKANRLRSFWRQESNYIVGRLISCLLDYWHNMKSFRNQDISPEEQILFEYCKRITDRLQVGTIVEDISVFEQFDDEKNFALLSKSIKECIDKNDPESGLDRLHTYAIKYARKLCDKHGISYDKEKPLHSLFGEYVKFLKQNKLIESEMTVRILRASTSILDAFNEVRNKQSLAHDNPILNHDESVLIFTNISSIIKYIQLMEKKIDSKSQIQDNTELDDIPF